MPPATATEEAGLPAMIVPDAKGRITSPSQSVGFGRADRLAVAPAQSGAHASAEIVTAEGSSAGPSAVEPRNLASLSRATSRVAVGDAGLTAEAGLSAGGQPTIDPNDTDRTESVRVAKTALVEGLDTAADSIREKPAAPRARDAATTAAAAGSNNHRNFLNVGQQGVGESRTRLGTDVAEEIQPMPANATDLPPATHALAAAEPVVGAGGASAEPSGAGNSRAVVETGPARSVAAETVRQLLETAERVRETGRNHVEFQVRTSDDGSLRVNLRWHDGVVHARFVTESTEMQQALSREWALAAPRLAEKGLKFDQPSFEHHDQSGHQSTAQDGFSFAHQHHSSRGQERTFELAGTSGRASTAPLVAARSTNSQLSGMQPQDRSMPVPRPAAGVANLRAWA